jgi:hypothetical protein
MYILNATIENIRSIRQFKLEFEPKECPGWHVLIGDNGSGKTTVVRALALGLVGSKSAHSLRQNWIDWISQSKLDYPSEESPPGNRGVAPVRLELLPDPNHDSCTSGSEFGDTVLSVLCLIADPEMPKLRRRAAIYRQVDDNDEPIDKGYEVVHESDTGWFSVSYGPFRRFLGGDPEHEQLFESHPRVAAHLSAFGEDVAFTHIIFWLRDLRFKQLEAGEDDDSGLLGDLRRFINDSELLPHDTTLQEVTSDEVVFRDGNGCKVDINQLSDGYRSVLSLTFELIRQLVRAYGREKVFVREGDSVRPQIELPGVVIVDEIDAHLHPTWQRRIGKWFTKRFPQLQFIVTTHSPLVCQAAAEGGSVWRLPTPGVENDGGRITGTELKRLTLGNVLEAYGTEAFGGDVNRSELSQQKMKRLAQLNQKALHQSLDDTEQQEQFDLRSALPTSAGTLDTTGGEAR